MQDSTNCRRHMLRDGNGFGLAVAVSQYVALMDHHSFAASHMLFETVLNLNEHRKTDEAMQRNPKYVDPRKLEQLVHAYSDSISFCQPRADDLFHCPVSGRHLTSVDFTSRSEHVHFHGHNRV